MVVAGSWIRPPQQKRSRASFERVLTVATELLEAEGYARFTLAEVSRRSGVSIGAIYVRVPSKDALFYAIHDRVMQQIASENAVLSSAEHWAQLSTAELIVEAVRELARPLRTHAAILQVIMHRGAIDDVVARFGSANASASGDQFKELLLVRRADFAHPDPELAVDIAFRIVFSTCARRVMYGPTFESQRVVDWDEIVHELGVACAGYLL